MKFAINIAKIILSILIIVLSIIEGIGQTLTCKVIDATTKTPIEFAHIFLERNKVGSISKKNGEAIITLSQNYLEYDKLHCSFIGYKDTTFILHISDFLSPSFVDASTGLVSHS